MSIRAQLQELVSKMLEGKILLPEAISEFEKLYIENALLMNDHHLLRTAAVLGIHRNTLTKKIGNGTKRTSSKSGKKKTSVNKGRNLSRRKGGSTK